MIDRSDVQGRLRLFRYGLIVVVVVTFLVSLVVPLAFVNGQLASAGLPTMSIGEALGTAVQMVIIVAIIAVVAYVAYHYVLTKSLPFMGGNKTS